MPHGARVVVRRRERDPDGSAPVGGAAGVFGAPQRPQVATGQPVKLSVAQPLNREQANAVSRLDWVGRLKVAGDERGRGRGPRELMEDARERHVVDREGPLVVVPGDLVHHGGPNLRGTGVREEPGLQLEQPSAAARVKRLL